MNPEIIATRSGNGYSYSVHVEGLSSLMRFLGKSAPEIRKAMRDGLKESAQPVLTAARANARRIADDGTFERSLSVRAYSSGALKLASTDPAARVKEFANLGAVTRTSKGTPLANSRLRMRSGVGVPRRANPPRVMYRALNENVEDVANRISEKIDEVLGGIDG